MSNSPGYGAQFVRDQENNLYAFWWDSLVGLVYASWQLDGTWSTPEQSPGGFYPSIDVDANGDLYLTYKSGYPVVNQVWYTHKPKNGEWATPEMVYDAGTNSIQDSMMVVETNGTMHQFIVTYTPYNQPDHFYHMFKTINSPWSTPIDISTGVTGLGGAAIGPDDQLHVFWLEYPHWKYSTKLSGSSEWTTPEILNIADFNGSKIMIDPANKVYLAWSTSDRKSVQTMYRTVGDLNWSQPITLYSLPPGTDALISSISMNSGDDLRVDYLWIIYYYNSGKFPLYICSMKPDGTISNTVFSGFDHLSGGMHSISLPGGGGLVSWDDGYPDRYSYYAMYKVGESYQGGVKQTVFLEPNMNEPTLLFTYKTDLEGAAGKFNVSINETMVFTQIQNVNWNYQWLDLSDWLNQPITLTFSLENSGGPTAAVVYLDEVSVGSWTTPIITAVSPGALEVWTTDTITVTGENFMDGAAIYLDEIEITGATVVSPTEMTFNLPAGLDPGFYDLWVENPGGVRNVRVNALHLGNPIYLPAINR